MQNPKLIAIVLILALSACAVGPDYVRPHTLVPIVFKENKHWKIAQPQDTCDRGPWWAKFHDAELNKLEMQLNLNNQTIETAYQQYKQAEALVLAARAALYPTVAGSLSFSRQKQGSRSVANSSAPILTDGTSASISNNYVWFLNANWEPDIFGKVRRTIEARTANAQANAALLSAIRLSAEASLAQFYFQLRGLDSAQQLLNNTVNDYKKILQLIKNRYAVGVASRADVVQAKSQLEIISSSAINNKILRAQYEHAIAVLIGLPPANFYLEFHPLQKAALPVIPMIIPSTLLERRPDIAEAERLMAQANAEIGIATSAYFPTLSLTGEASAITSQLFTIPIVNWALGAELAQVLIDSGLRRAQVKASEANYHATVASYRQTVLTAFQDVEDNLSALNILTEQEKTQKQAALSAKQALGLLINQYKAGTLNYTDVIAAETTAYTAEKNSADITALKMAAAVRLIRALGGDW